MSASRVAEFQQHSGKVLWNIAVAMVYAAVIMIAERASDLIRGRPTLAPAQI